MLCVDIAFQGKFEAAIPSDLVCVWYARPLGPKFLVKTTEIIHCRSIRLTPSELGELGEEPITLNCGYRHTGELLIFCVRRLWEWQHNTVYIFLFTAVLLNHAKDLSRTLPRLRNLLLGHRMYQYPVDKASITLKVSNFAFASSLLSAFPPYWSLSSSLPSRLQISCSVQH